MTLNHLTARFEPMKRATWRLSATALAAILSFGGLASKAAEHQLTKINHDAARNVTVLDLVMSIDWDFDSPPAGRDKAFIEGILRQASQSLYTMTEGKQMLGKVYVYKNSQFMTNTDIQYLAADGRANAHVAGITGCKPCRVQQFAGTGETPVDHGKTVAHEFGHYVLGLFDEYREVGGTSTDIGFPQDGDTPRDTMMHNHLQFANVSTADDYLDTNVRKTAQFRVYGKSAWEVMVSPSESDPERAGSGRRVYFDAFKNMAAPTASALRRPTTGWENDLQVVYMGGAAAPAAASDRVRPNAAVVNTSSGPINVIVIDTTTTADHLAAQRTAAMQMIDAAGPNNRVAVYAFPFNLAPVVDLTRLNSDAARTAVKAAIGKIAGENDSTDAVVADRLFALAETLAPSLAPKGPASQSAGGFVYRLYPTGIALGVSSGVLYLYNPTAPTPLQSLGPVSAFLPQAKGTYTDALQKALALINGIKVLGDTPAVTPITVATRTVDSALVASFRGAGVAVNPLGITTPGAASQAGRFRAQAVGQTSLHDLAKGTFGAFKEGAKVSELARAAGKVANSSEGDSVEVISDAESSGPLAAGATHVVTSVVAAGGIDGKIVFSAFWNPADDAKLSYSLTTPSGTTVSPTSLPAGITYNRDATEGEATYTVAANFAGLAGTWRSTVSASAATTDAVGQEVLADTQLSAVIELHGMAATEKGAGYAVVEVSGPLAVENAVVKADVYNAATGATVRTGLTLKDDGVAPDDQAGDGQYAVDLSDLPNGEYEIVVTVTNGGQAAFTTKGNTKQGTNKPPVALPSFQRVTSELFVKER